MPKLPSTGIEVISVEVREPHAPSHILPHTPEFKECLHTKYKDCNDKFPAMRLVVRREFEGETSITIDQINETYRKLNDCKSEAYKWCREAFSW